MRFSIAGKLSAGFAAAGAVTIGLVIFTYISLQDLRQLQDDGALRAEHATEVTLHAGLGPRLYQIVADGVINRNFDQTRADWAAIKTEMEQAFAYDKEVVDSDDERRWAAEAVAAYTELVGVVEREMFPLLQASEEVNAEVRALDGRVDELVATIQDRYHSIRQSVQREAEEADASFDSLAAQMVIANMIFAGGAVIGTLIIVLVFSRLIAGPVKGMTKAMEKLAAGDLEVAVPAVGRGDEIGEMAGAVQVFKDNALKVARMEAEQQEAERRAAEEKRRSMQILADDFEASVGAVVKSVVSSAEEMQGTAQVLTATAEETSRQASVVAAASEEASTNVQTVASASEELAASIDEISRQVAQSATIASKAVEDADRTNQQIQGLADAAQKIDEVVQLITNIASQTNLLALNATIEAARAGDAGKGFAVVASEVKNLANETAKATEEITGQISSIQQATQLAVTAIREIGQTIGQINSITTTIASAVEEQGAATQEIARNVQQAAAGTQEVSANIAGVTQASGETGAAASQINTASGELSRQGYQLRVEVERFLAAVRAG